MRRWLWEMQMCCSMQLTSLRKNLHEFRGKNPEPGAVIGSGFTSAPYDEMLFDSVRLYATVQEDGRIAVGGTVFFWCAAEGYSEKTAILRTFDCIDPCLAWMENECAASEECAAIFDSIR